MIFDSPPRRRWMEHSQSAVPMWEMSEQRNKRRTFFSQLLITTKAEISSFKWNSCHHRRQNWKMLMFHVARVELWRALSFKFSLLTNSKSSWQYWPLRWWRLQSRGSYCGLLAMLHHLMNLLCQSKYWETHGLQNVMRQESTVQIHLLNKICEHIINAPWATELAALIFGKFVSLKSFISPLHKCFIKQNEKKMKGRKQTEQ